MNMVSHLIFHRYNCDENRAFVTLHKSTAPRQVGLVVYLMQKLRLRGHPPPIIFARTVRPMNALPDNFVADSFHTNKLFSRISSIQVQF